MKFPIASALKDCKASASNASPVPTAAGVAPDGVGMAMRKLCPLGYRSQVMWHTRGAQERGGYVTHGLDRRTRTDGLQL